MSLVGFGMSGWQTRGTRRCSGGCAASVSWRVRAGVPAAGEAPVSVEVCPKLLGKCRHVLPDGTVILRDLNADEDPLRFGMGIIPCRGGAAQAAPVIYSVTLERGVILGREE
jgi:hypothetical protein